MNKRKKNTKKYKKDTLFSFNLMTKKSKEELLEIEERDESTFYTLILVFFGVLIYFLLTLMQFILVDAKLQSTKNNIKSVEQSIASYENIRAINGELFIKSNLLTPILEQDIKVNDFLNITKEIIGNTQVVSYSRESSGVFVVSITADKYSKVLDVLKTSRTKESVEKVEVRDISFDETRFNKYIVVLEFILKA